MLISLYVFIRVCAVTICGQAAVCSTRSMLTLNNGLEGMPRGVCMCGEKGIIKHKVELQYQRYSYVPRTGKMRVTVC